MRVSQPAHHVEHIGRRGEREKQRHDAHQLECIPADQRVVDEPLIQIRNEQRYAGAREGKREHEGQPWPIRPNEGEQSPDITSGGLARGPRTSGFHQINGTGYRGFSLLTAFERGGSQSTRRGAPRNELITAEHLQERTKDNHSKSQTVSRKTFAFSALPQRSSAIKVF